MPNPVAKPSARRAQPRPPSPPWFGGVAIGSVGLMAAIILTYTLAGWEWQQRIGGWNYVAVVVLIVVASVMMRAWRPDEST